MRDTPTRDAVHQATRVVVKIGSALLAQAAPDIFTHLAAQIAVLRSQHKEVLIVSSGAVALGLPVLGYAKRPKRLMELQAAAAAGQPQLLQRWQQTLAKFNIPVAQVLLTHADLSHRERFLNSRHALLTLLERGVVPIINENDSVATEEMRVGDNDQLSAGVAGLVDAGLLIILTTVDGLYTDNPEANKDSKRIRTVRRPREVRHLAGEAGASGLGVGGMRTKVDAANIAARRAIPVVITHGSNPSVLQQVMAGEDIGTYFCPRNTQTVTSRKHWISYILKPGGALHVDAGAAQALRGRGRSLLPKGVRSVDGSFHRGTMVAIHGPGRTGVVARGLAAYSADEIRRIAGHDSRAIPKLLGYIYGPEVIHRDDLVLLSEDD